MTTPRVPVLAAVVAFSGCGYTSHYVSPVDGRARAVWAEDQVRLEVAGPPPEACRAAVEELVAPGSASRRAERRAVWVPAYYGPTILVTSRGYAPVFPVYPVFIPSLVMTPGPGFAWARRGGGWGDRGWRESNPGRELAVLLLLVLPVVDVGLALQRAEDVDSSRWALSRVGAYNDLARQPGSPCAPGAP
jgi:hypothetical protein